MPNVRGEDVFLYHFLNNGPVVLSFYRGAGGHSVILELRALQRTLLEIKELGGSLIAVSPHLPDNSLSIAEKLAIEFEVLSFK